ncbi:MAG: two-component regulator propeller domain-containing protein [Bacteroidota bacterium]
MPSSEVYDVFQDKRGFIWFATDNGVVRFDGHEMTVFRTPDGLEDPVVFGIQEDYKGRIWFRTFSGKLFYFENEKITAYRYNDILLKALTKALLMSMHVDRSDRLWFVSSPYWGSVDAKGNLSVESIPLESTWFKTIKDDGYLISRQMTHLGTTMDIYVNGESFPIARENKHLHSASSYAVQWKNKLYLTTNHCIYEYDKHTLKKVLDGKAPIIFCHKDQSDRLWVGYRNIGLEYYTEPDFKSPKTFLFLKKKSVSNVMEDREGGLWISTLENGVFYIPDLTLAHYHYADSAKVKSVLTTADHVLFGHYDGTLAVMNQKTRKIDLRKKFDSPVLALFEDREKNIWISITPLTLFDNNLREIRNYLDISPPVDFVVDRKGNLHAFSNLGLLEFDSNANVVSWVNHLAYPRNMVVEDSLVYVGERLGLRVYDRQINFRYEPKTLSKFKISKLVALNDSILFVGTIGNGFLLANRHSWSVDHFNLNNRFFISDIYAATRKDSLLWLGTEKGILAFNTDKLIKGEPSFRHYTKSYGLTENKVNYLALTNNELWALSDNGYSILPYASIMHEHPKPQFYFKEARVNKVKVDVEKEAKMSYDSTELSVTFGFLSLRDQNILCRYRLASGDPWIYTSGRKIQLSSLAPGSYQLEISYSLDNFYWHLASSSFLFTVTPPWWQRWYVHLIILVFICGTAYLSFKNYYRIQYKHQQRLIQAEIETLEKERNRIARELHDGVATNLSAIKLMVSQLLRTHQDPLAEDVDEHFLSTITEIKDIIYGLTPPGLKTHGLFAGLRNYVEKLNRAIPIKLELSTTGGEIYKSELGLLSFRIIQELISNAIKHAKAKNISIQVHVKERQVNIQFQDDGVGFVYDSSKGLGLANVESRVQSVQGQLKFESNDKGTTYLISLPFN